MTTYWRVDTHGDPLGVLRDLLKTIWVTADLDGLFVPANGVSTKGHPAHLLEDSRLLEYINPFRPLMTANIARQVPELLRERPAAYLGAMLRPCEMRAIKEIAQRGAIDRARLLTISVDCLGTYPSEDFQWLARRKGSPELLTAEALRFARLGGIVTYRYRSACQMCTSPEACQADVNIAVLGLPVRQCLLITAKDDLVSEKIRLSDLADGHPAQDLVDNRARLLVRLCDRNQSTRERIIQSLADILPTDLDLLIQQFESCGDCQNCLDSCPICVVDYPQREGNGRYLRADIQRWLLSCAGCGMCEQACPNHLPLSAIFRHIKQELQALQLSSPRSPTGGTLPLVN